MPPSRMGVAVFHYAIGDARSTPVKLENLTLVIKQDGKGNKI